MTDKCIITVRSLGDKRWTSIFDEVQIEHASFDAAMQRCDDRNIAERHYEASDALAIECRLYCEAVAAVEDQMRNIASSMLEAVGGLDLKTIWNPIGAADMLMVLAQKIDLSETLIDMMLDTERDIVDAQAKQLALREACFASLAELGVPRARCPEVIYSLGGVT